jgi:DNA-binding phage protein
MTKISNLEIRQRMATDVRTAMAAFRFTTTEVAEKAGVSTTIINHLRTAKGNPGINNIHKVYDALQLERIDFNLL